MVQKRFVAVITFDDADGDIADLSSAATWVEAAMTGSTSKAFEVTTYSTAASAAADEATLAGDFAVPAEAVPLEESAAPSLHR